ncbi:tRNA G18 (ribose-2'-O)-methylase SpoU [Mumia flava]|uniref:tRNA G18 (Ribose-2'-O)-methylase SpoU n=1 Tax=Mumia flava TaxID=1348852 RepID=A0A0B2B4K3_9ACTN|nr:RNA methyltransferase [Mumia flava]PJJ53547.1 tRNA G18 (ribose-2'-O)-methylase SpoU [Mumia flava]
MAELIEVGDPADVRLRDYVDLRDVQLRKLLETERGLFIAEGEKVVRRALESGHRARSFLMSPRWLDPLADLLDTTDAPVYVMADDAVERLTGFHVHRGALASLERAPLPDVAEVLAGARRVVVAEDLMDHANIGSVFRAAAALGFDAVVLSPRCADPLYRRAIKVSMGSVFWLPYARVADWYAFPDLLREHGFTSLAMTLAPDAVDLREVAAQHRGTDSRLALMVGGEGHGLSARWTKAADLRVTIPLAASIDSLNVASATAVACWALGGA